MQHQQIPHTITIIALILCIVFALTYGIDNPSCQQTIALTTPDTNCLPHSSATSMPTRLKEAERHRKEEEAMAKATLERVKEATT
jgi:hypothetical protein